MRSLGCRGWEGKASIISIVNLVVHPECISKDPGPGLDARRRGWVTDQKPCSCNRWSDALALHSLVLLQHHWPIQVFYEVLPRSERFRRSSVINSRQIEKPQWLIATPESAAPAHSQTRTRPPHCTAPIQQNAQPRLLRNSEFESSPIITQAGIYILEERARRC